MRDTSRREFLDAGGRFLLAAMATPGLARANNAYGIAHSIGLQLFTLFDILDTDVPGTLQKVAQIGYRDLQSSYSKQAGVYGLTPRAFAAMVNDLGMSWSSHHVPSAPRRSDAGVKPRLDSLGKPVVYSKTLTLQDNLDEVIDLIGEAGVPYLVCAGVATETLDDVQASIDLLSRAAEACKKAGLKLGLHNHDKEFRQLGNSTPYELILQGTRGADLTMELDIAWAVKAGVDPVELFQRHPGRFGLWHVKDIDAKLLRPEPLGQGIIDFRPIFMHAGTAGMRHFYVEHDAPADPMMSIATSFRYLERLFATE